MLNGCTGEDAGHPSTYLYTYVSAREDAGRQQRVPYVSTKPRRRNPPSSAPLKIKLPPANSTKATKLYLAPGKKSWKPGNFSRAWILWIPSFVNFRKDEPLVKILGERLSKGELGPAMKLRWGKTSPQVLMVYLYVEDVRDPRQVSRVIENAFSSMETGGSSTAYNQMLNKW